MEALSTGTLIFLLGVIFAYGVYHLYLRYAHSSRHYSRVDGQAVLSIERDDAIVDRAGAMVYISYACDDPLALRFDYFISHQYFDTQRPNFSVSVDREVVAHALATGTSQNYTGASSIFFIVCDPSHLKGKGRTTLTWLDPKGSKDVHLLTIATQEMHKVLNKSYAMVPPGAELEEASNNLDSVLDDILQGSQRSPSTDD